MKAVLAVLFTLFSLTIYSQGAGNCTGAGNPNNNSEYEIQDDRYECLKYFDTTNDKWYTYEPSLTQGARWIEDVDNNTTYTSGSGIDLSGNEFSLTPKLSERVLFGNYEQSVGLRYIQSAQILRLDDGAFNSYNFNNAVNPDGYGFKVTASNITSSGSYPTRAFYINSNEYNDNTNYYSKSSGLRNAVKSVNYYSDIDFHLDRENYHFLAEDTRYNTTVFYVKAKGYQEAKMYLDGDAEITEELKLNYVNSNILKADANGIDNCLRLRKYY